MTKKRGGRQTESKDFEKRIYQEGDIEVGVETRANRAICNYILSITAACKQNALIWSIMKK